MAEIVVAGDALPCNVGWRRSTDRVVVHRRRVLITARATLDDFLAQCTAAETQWVGRDIGW